MININTIINKFASANRFEVIFPGMDEGILNPAIVVYSAKSVELPSIERKQIEKVWNGVKYPIAREVSYKNTTEITFYMTEDGLRENFMKWMQFYSEEYDTDKSDTNEKKVYQDIKVVHKRSSGMIDDNKEYIEYTFLNSFPTEISAVSLSSENNELLEFTVTFAFSLFTKSDIEEEKK